MSADKKTVSFSCYPGGSLEITKATFTIYQVTEGEPVQLVNMPIVVPGFDFELPLETSDYYYVVVQITSFRLWDFDYLMGDRNVSLITVFKGSDDAVYISAQSTIASAFGFARMTSTDASGREIIISGTARKLSVAMGMKENFFTTRGRVSDVIALSPNGMETNSLGLFNVLSNLAYYCLPDAGVYNNFLALACGNTPSQSFFQALMYIIYKPFTNTQAICDLISGMYQVFQPSLFAMPPLPRDASPVPNQWTLTIKANNSGSTNFIPAGAAFVVFDKEGKAWIANNFRSGSANSGTHCVVLNADGSPAAISPVFGGGLLGAAFGAAVDPTGEIIAIGNFGWGEELNNPQHGSVSVFKYDGTVLSPADGFTNMLSRVQGMCYDKAGNLWMASVGYRYFAPTVQGDIQLTGPMIALPICQPNIIWNDH
jgi:hypothetical protein